jgi:hypothetical protein
MLKTKKDLIAHCLTYPDVYEDYPFHDHEWAVIRHRSNRRVRLDLPPGGSGLRQCEVRSPVGGILA